MKKKRQFEVVTPGVYLAKGQTLFVEVIRQDIMTGQLWLEVYGETDPDKRYEGMSASMFLKLFVKTDMQTVALPSIPKD
jgi:hypothetical protein